MAYSAVSGRYVEDFVSGVDTVLRAGHGGRDLQRRQPAARERDAAQLELSRRVLHLLGKPESLLEFVVDRPAHDRRYRVDPAKLLALGWQPSGSSGTRSTRR